MTDRKSKPKAIHTSRAEQPRKLATMANSSPKAGAQPKPNVRAKPYAATKQPVSAKLATVAGCRRIDERMQSLGDWRAEKLTEVRRLIHEADPDIEEEIKWVKPTNPLGVPVWSHAGIVCTGEAYKQVIKLTFPRGASLKDPRGLFNASLDGNTRRAIDIRAQETLDANAFKDLIRAAVAENLRSKVSKSRVPVARAGGAKPATKTAKPIEARKGPRVVRLSGGNPQIAKAEGNAPVEAYIAAMPGWKRELGHHLDSLIVRNVPGVRKAVKWNSPFYGVEGQGWFLSFHVFTHYVKVTFFRGTSLTPVPPGGTGKDARWIDIREKELNELQMAAWVKQAAALPGWMA